MAVYAPAGFDECLRPSTRWVEIALPILEKKLELPVPFEQITFLFCPLYDKNIPRFKHNTAVSRVKTMID